MYGIIVPISHAARFVFSQPYRGGRGERNSGFIATVSRRLRWLSSSINQSINAANAQNYHFSPDVDDSAKKG